MYKFPNFHLNHSGFFFAVYCQWRYACIGVFVVYMNVYWLQYYDVGETYKKLAAQLLPNCMESINLIFVRPYVKAKIMYSTQMRFELGTSRPAIDCQHNCNHQRSLIYGFPLQGLWFQATWHLYDITVLWGCRDETNIGRYLLCSM